MIIEFKTSTLVTADLIEEYIHLQKVKWDSEQYYFDEKEAKLIYKFASKLTIDKIRKDTQLILLKFQFDIITDILCVKRSATGLRKHREAHINVARKNGKSFLIAIIMTYLYFVRPTYGSEYVLSANTVQQASLLFNTICHFIKTTPLKTLCKMYTSRKYIEQKQENSFLRVLSSDGTNADSYASGYFCLDEIHEASDASVYTKLRTGGGIFDETLAITITTASSGDDPDNLEMMLYSYAQSVKKGEIEDDSFYSAIFEADKDCDIADKEQWYKANPALGVFRKTTDLEDLLKMARYSPVMERTFRRLYLNQHVSMAVESAINMDLWNQALQKVNYEDLQDFECWAGLDLSHTQDITAFVEVFYNAREDKIIVYPHLFTPEATLEERSDKDRVPYATWVKQGHLIALEGAFINYKELHKFIESRQSVNEIYFDRWGAVATKSYLEENFDLIEFEQNVRGLTPIIRDFENLLIDKKLIIHDNPVLNFMAKNVVAKVDDSGNIRYSKNKSKYKIDGIIAMLMGLQGCVNSVFGSNYSVNTGVEEYLKRKEGNK